MTDEGARRAKKPMKRPFVKYMSLVVYWLSGREVGEIERVEASLSSGRSFRDELCAENGG